MSTSGEQRPGELAPEFITVNTVLEAHGLRGLSTLDQKHALERLGRDGRLERYEIRVCELGGYLPEGTLPPR